MPPTELLVFREANGRIPLVDWLDFLPAKARAKCLNYMRLLATSGHELRRPAADFLRDGIYELRASYGGVQYRILYFFHGRDVVVLSHGITKSRRVPGSEIDRAIERKELVMKDPLRYARKLASREA
jgi:phage-related protein